ncbi:type III secretion protein SpaR/YscT/HrcT [Burkholderia lata]|uniref:type III secretion system export apparatus subunit SctT n=1 Tax=Burkholderia lata (strain ATCC 17760 / DSM 23089 / LMG 22485 / NCIMB 9086 / R18194 / 383) TaxID=482957 RepID=UPI00145392DF|nr:type III secretion system export apparatus subunit SctT [Burkholderia lata]VWD64978.1 type III secretion protein SpaR/YscT/HrcT [Burkholderia lata]
MEVKFWWSLVGLAMMRPLGALLFLPLCGTSTLGGLLIRNSLVLMVALPVLPLLALQVLPDPIQAPGDYVLLLGSELAVGLVLGFSAAIAFWAVDSAGFLLDTLRGASMAGVLNPMFGGQSSPLGAFFSQLLVALFMTLGGFHSFLSAIYNSYEFLKPGRPLHWTEQFIPFLKCEWHLLYTLALSFAMPAMVMMILVDLALGLINRSVQQLNVFALSMPIKCATAVLMLIIGLQFGLSDVIVRLERFDGGLMRTLESGR